MQTADEYEFVADEFKTQPVISDVYPIVMAVAFEFFHGSNANGAFRLFHLIDDLTHAGQQRFVSVAEKILGETRFETNDQGASKIDLISPSGTQSPDLPCSMAEANPTFSQGFNDDLVQDIPPGFHQVNQDLGQEFLGFFVAYGKFHENPSLFISGRHVALEMNQPSLPGFFDSATTHITKVHIAKLSGGALAESAGALG